MEEDLERQGSKGQEFSIFQLLRSSILDQPAPRKRFSSLYHLDFKIDVSKYVCVNSMSRGRTRLLNALRETHRMDIFYGITRMLDGRPVEDETGSADFQETASHVKLMSNVYFMYTWRKLDVQPRGHETGSADFKETASHVKLISGVYRNDQSHGKVTFEMEDCAFNGKGNRWFKNVKFRIQKSHFQARIERKNPWLDINELYPNAEVKMKHNIVEVTIDSPQENHEFAVFGVPDVDDRKRMQVGLFGEKPLRGEDWKIWVIIFDDTMMAFQNVCKMEESRGLKLLTPPAGLFVFNSGEDIKINVRDVELGWKIKDGTVKIIKSNDAWHSPENSIDFPRCYFEVSHVDQWKTTFTCGVTVSHKLDSAQAEVAAVFEEPRKEREEFHLPFAGNNAADDFSEVLAFLKMFALAMWFINSAVQPGVVRDQK